MRPGLEVEGDEGERVAGAGQRGLVLVLKTHGQDLRRTMVNIIQGVHKHLALLDYAALLDLGFSIAKYLLYIL